MRADQIGERLVARYNFNNRQSLLNDLLDALKRYKEEELERIWQKFDVTYLGLAAPKPAHFHSIAIDLGINTKESGGGGMWGAWICKCGQIYAPMTAYVCPKCKSHEVVAVGDAAHRACIDVDENAPWYREAIEKLIQKQEEKRGRRVEYKDVIG